MDGFDLYQIIIQLQIDFYAGANKGEQPIARNELERTIIAYGRACFESGLKAAKR